MIVTTRELYNRAAAAADMHDGFVTPAQSMYWASQENLNLALFLARSGWIQNVLTTTLTVDGTEAGVFDLDVSPLAIVAVHHVRGGVYRQLKHNNAIDFLRQTPGSGPVTGDPTEYRVTWNQADDLLSLSFYPEPQSGTTIVVSYIPEPDRLTLSDNPDDGYANSVNYPMGWEERIVLGMARRALEKEESDSTPVLRQIRECESYIEEACWNRALAESPTIRNVDRRSRETFAYPPASQWIFF